MSFLNDFCYLPYSITLVCSNLLIIPRIPKNIKKKFPIEYQFRMKVPIVRKTVSSVKAGINEPRTKFFKIFILETFLNSVIPMS